MFKATLAGNMRLTLSVPTKVPGPIEIVSPVVAALMADCKEGHGLFTEHAVPVLPRATKRVADQAAETKG